MIYFDHNATSPISSVAKEAWIEACDRYPANPSSPHRLGSRTEVALSSARQQVAGYLGCDEFDVIWTSGATEANNAVFSHLAQSGSGPILVSTIEHPSVLAAAHRWVPSRVKLLRVTIDGVLDLDFLATELARSPAATVALMAANNETGARQPWPEALKLCRAHGAHFFCDAAQWVGKEPAAGLGDCDFVSGCGHKFGGPLGTGLLKVPPGFKSLLVGGPQEEGRRAGTENLPGIISFVAAWAEREALIASGELESRLRWRDQFITELQRTIPGIEVLALHSPRLWNTVAAIMPLMPDCRRRWVVRLDKLGFAVSTGSACASGKEKPSHVLSAMQFDSAKSDRMLRFSSGWNTTENEWQLLLEAVQSAFADLRG